MLKKNFSLFSFFAIVTCLMLLMVAIYERNRANEIESKSLVLATPEYRAIVEQDWEVMRHQLQHQRAVAQFETEYSAADTQDDDLKLLPTGARRKLANLRNSELKLARKRLQLQTTRDEVTTQLLRSMSN